MAFTNFDEKEINCKVVFFGPRGSGKTENLKSIYHQIDQLDQSSDGGAGSANSLNLQMAEGSTEFFDFLPISVTEVNGFHLKFHLFTMPCSNIFDTLNQVILAGTDGFIFVADSRVEALPENLESLSRSKRLLAEMGCQISEMPRAIQYNKRDLPDVMPLSILRSELNPGSLPDFEAVANQSVGTLDTLNSIASQVIAKLHTSLAVSD